MHNEWFYLSRWRENNRPNWAVIDKGSESVVKSSLSKIEAERLSYVLNQKENNYFVVNIKNELYNKYCKQDVKNENI